MVIRSDLQHGGMACYFTTHKPSHHRTGRATGRGEALKFLIGWSCDSVIYLTTS